jgi:ferredoxin
MKKKYIIEYERGNCIGVAACVASAPDLWELDKDGKANLLLNKKDGKKEMQTIEVELDEKELDKIVRSAEVCPVNVIRIIEKESKNRLV